MGRINRESLVRIIVVVLLFVGAFWAYSNTQDVYIRYACLGAGIVLLIWVIISIVLNITVKNSRCPKCSHIFSRSEHKAFAQGFYSHKAGPCPACGTVLIKSKWPWRLLIVGQQIMLGVFLLYIVLDIVLEDMSDRPLVMYLIWSVFSLAIFSYEVGYATLRLEVVGDPKNLLKWYWILAGSLCVASVIVVCHRGITLSQQEDVPGEIPVKLLKQTKIAFVSTRDGNSEIYIMNPDGTEQENLTNHPARDYEPEWLPDGKIRFESDRDGKRKKYVMDVHGNLLPSGEESEKREWSPFSGVRMGDGTYICFAGTGKDYAIVRRSLNTKEQEIIQKVSISTDFALPPDKTRIVYNAKSWWTGHQIYTMNVDGSEKKRLTYRSGLKDKPSWSPDGKMITFRLWKGKSEIYIMNADGSGQRRLTSVHLDPNRHLDHSPSWSPFLTSEKKAAERE